MNTVIGADGGDYVSRTSGALGAAFIAVFVIAGVYLIRRAFRDQRRVPHPRHAARWSHPHR